MMLASDLRIKSGALRPKCTAAAESSGNHSDTSVLLPLLITTTPSAPDGLLFLPLPYYCLNSRVAIRDSADPQLMNEALPWVAQNTRIRRPENWRS